MTNNVEEIKGLVNKIRRVLFLFFQPTAHELKMKDMESLRLTLDLQRQTETEIEMVNLQ